MDEHFINGYKITIAQSAYKHGFSDEDIICALENYIEVLELDDDPNKYLYIGFDASMRELELVVVELIDDCLKVIHCMKVRKSIRKLIKELRDGK